MNHVPQPQEEKTWLLFSVLDRVTYVTLFYEIAYINV